LDLVANKRQDQIMQTKQTMWSNQQLD